MDAISPEEARVLGCLIEKEATTPEAYPLSMNALILACNQTSNRTPVVAYDETVVSEALGRLRERKFARVVYGAHGSRVSRYRHALPEVWAITAAELAVLAVLMLRGPQTVNELTTRTERYRADLDDLGGVIGVLERLAARPEPLAVRMGRQPGQREERWMQLLAEEEGPRPAAAASRARDNQGPREASAPPAWGGDDHGSRVAPGPPAWDTAGDGPPEPTGPPAWGRDDHGSREAPTPPAWTGEAARSPAVASADDLEELAEEVRQLRHDLEELRDVVDRLTGPG